MPVTPDLEGFAEAQRRHRQLVGVDVTFLGEPVVTFPPGTAIDEETGLPYDPLLQPTASVQASAVMRCSVARRVLRDDHEKETQAGIGEVSKVMLITNPEASAVVGSAVAFVLDDHEYKVVGLRTDAPVAGGDRLLIFGKGAGRAHA